jgi:hypothetical protein
VHDFQLDVGEAFYVFTALYLQKSLHFSIGDVRVTNG